VACPYHPIGLDADIWLTLNGPAGLLAIIRLGAVAALPPKVGHFEKLGSEGLVFDQMRTSGFPLATVPVPEKKFPVPTIREFHRQSLEKEEAPAMGGKPGASGSFMGEPRMGGTPITQPFYTYTVTP
jgi:hypothetical protein